MWMDQTLNKREKLKKKIGLKISILCTIDISEVEGHRKFVNKAMERC